jgi:predicted transcriptional regulator of viral defense system
MNAKTLDQIREILANQNGLLLTSDLARLDIARTYLTILEKNGEIERIARGVYQARLAALEDELFVLQATHRASVYSHETALYLHDLSDRSPLAYSLSVPVGYHSAALRHADYKVFYVNRGLFDLGVVTVKSPHGNPIRVTGLERTICDAVRSRKQMDMQLVYDALKRYVTKTERNLDLLYRYAQAFRVQTVMRRYIEVLL